MSVVSWLLFGYYLYTIDAATMVLEAPEYILARDSFNISCQTNGLSSLKVKNCNITSTHLERESASNTFRWEYQVMHVKKPCEVECYSSIGQKEMKIPVRGKD